MRHAHLNLGDITPNQDNSNKRVVVAMSGGVDSSVAAGLLVAQGFEVIGVMMRLYSEPAQGSETRHNRCCTPDQMADARKVASQLNIPFYVLDTQEYFYNVVVQPFINGHVAGQTPNPCIACNRTVRFDFLLKHALALGADYLATGHYARVKKTKEGYQLKKAIDDDKDQSYVLHVLGQYELGRVKFPVGDYTKPEVRTLARQLDLPVATKSESMDLCFLADGDYRRFLADNAADSFQPGPIKTLDGSDIGQHQGLGRYTIGQRKGLGVSVGQPMFVVKKDTAENVLILGTREEATRKRLIAQQVNWISGFGPAGPTRAEVKIRYRANLVPAIITALDGEKASVEFEEPVFGITAGQGAVFYLGEYCIGGGIIADEVI
jgi:tRNA-specific 2-thiouridylase